ncbi:protein Lines homolog 1 isoform X1 [Anguilla rostrata]|uniref:protein Lines homolog 1 isoform X1 n=1 Tax=Anguilla rostrata TaxID=7938 RepID=UPI0030CF77D5
MEHIFLVLQEVDSGLLLGTALGYDSHELASIICAGICEHSSGSSQNAQSSCMGDERSRPQTLPTLSSPFILMDEHKHEEKQKETLCFALSILERMSSKLLSPNPTVDCSVYYKDILRTSLEDMHLMSKLVSLFSIQDALLSHLAVKCVSSVVLFQLLESNTFNSIWQQKCFQTFQRGCPCNEMDSCLWSLTTVVKGVMKGLYKCKREILDKLLVAFDPVLPDLYTGLLSCGGPGSDIAACQIDSCNLETIHMAFVDLLEVLTAARVRLHICSMSQRLLYQRASVFLHLVDSPALYAVKKKVLLLLKRVLLEKAGDDLCIGEVPPSAQVDGQMTPDLWALADSVLRSASTGWVQRISVSGKASLFGGTSASGPGSREGPDFVMLRAVSLVLLKSLEYKVQQVSKQGSLCPVDIQSYLCPLMVFLSQHLPQSRQLCHSCAWVSLVFGDQDDDMIEAAMTLMLLYLYQKRVNATSDEDACSTGYNPHCLFIYLLKSVAFDHSVLLDFLISTETCFLEYFVKYLKFLRENWEGFRRSCLYTQGSDTLEQKSGSSGQESTMRSKLPANHANPQFNRSPASGATKSMFCPLVDYGSSDESEAEEPSVSDGPLGRPQDEGPELNCAAAGGRSLCLPEHAAEKAGDDHLTPDSMCEKTVMCLQELRKVIVRLQKRNLFPYKPASLLRLLMQIETKSGFGDGSQC